jgi:murE/murF fusion protein
MNNIVSGGSIVLNADDKFYNFHRKIALRKKLKVYSFSMNKKNVTVGLISVKKEKTKFKIIVNIDNQKKYFFISSNFENNLKNLLAAITVISIFKDIKNLSKNIFYNYQIPYGRGDFSKIKINKKNILLIDESYNSNPLSLKSSINNFDLIDSKNNKKHIILGDMLELGKHSKKLHLEMSTIINSSSINTVHIFGKYIKETYKNIHNKKKGLILKEISEIIDLIKNNINNNDYLMIKGSNATGLHKLTSGLKKRKKK